MLDVNLRAPIALARVLAPAMVGARARPPGVRLLALGQVRAAGLVDVLGHEVRAARVRPGAARGPARHAASASRWSRPGFIRDAGHVRQHRRQAARRAWARGPRRMSPTRSSRAIERNRAELDVAPLGLRVGSRPRLGRAGARRVGQQQAGVGADRRPRWPTAGAPALAAPADAVQRPLLGGGLVLAGHRGQRRP